MKSGYPICFRMTQAQVDAGDADSIAGSRIEIIDASSQPTGTIYESGPLGSAPTLILSASGALASAGYEKVQITEALYQLTPSVTGKTRIFHLETNATLATLSPTDWPIPTSPQKLEIQNHSGNDVTFWATGYSGVVDFDNNSVEEDSFVIKNNTMVSITIDQDGWIQIAPIMYSYSKVEVDTAIDNRAVNMKTRVLDINTDAYMLPSRGIHYRADDLVVAGINDNWTAVVGTSAVQLTGSLQPSNVLASVNGHNIVTFDGVGDHFHTTTPQTAYNAAQTFFVLYRGAGTLLAEQGRFYGPTSGNGMGLSIGSSTADNKLRFLNSSVAWLDPSSVAVDTTAGVVSLIGATWNKSANLASYYINGTAVGTASYSTLPTGTANIQIGTSEARTTTTLKGGICEFVLFPTVLSTTERQVVEGYLAWKYGTVTTLPVGHPYKLVAPSVVDIPTYETNELAIAGGLDVGKVYRRKDGMLQVVMPIAIAHVWDGVKVRKSASQSITHATSAALTWDVDEIDNSAYHSTTVNPDRLIAPKKGKYRLSVNVQWASNSNGVRGLFYTVNGSTQDIYLTMLPTVSGDNTRVGSSVILVLEAGDYFNWRVYQTSGAALNVDTSPITFATMEYLGS